MKKLAMSIPFLVIFLCVGLAPCASAQSDVAGYSDAAGDELLTPDELSDLLAPIALYPDPLIAQILPAATFVDQIEEAASYLRSYGSRARIDDQPWDVSVKAVAHYPDVLYMMDNRYDWTVALGQAYIDQPQEVMDAIQRLRAEARAQGNLYSTAQQQVIVSDDVVRIVPATPEYVYVPVYDPQVIYVERYDPYFPFITFGTGFFIGAWLNRDCDWRRHRVYYHGWRGGGWVGRARPHIHDNRGVYINRRAATINVNNRVLLRDSRPFRDQLRDDTWRRRQGPMMRPGRPVPGMERRAPGTERQRRIEGERRSGTRDGAGAGTTPAAPARPGGAPAAAGTTRSFSTSGQATGGTVAPVAVPPTTAPAAVPSRTGPAAVPSTTAPARDDQRRPGSRRPGRSGGDVNRGRNVGAQPAAQPATAAPAVPAQVSPAPAAGTGGTINRRVMEAPQTVGQPATAAPRRITPRMNPNPRAEGSPSRRGEGSIRRGATAAPATAAPTTPGTTAPAAPRRSMPVVPRSAAPITTVPRSAAPVTTVPRSAAPATTVPRSAAPVTTVPRSAAPVTTVPRSAAPVVVPRATAPTVMVPRTAPSMAVPRSAPAPVAAPRATAPMVMPRASAPAAPAAPAAPRAAPAAPIRPQGLPAGMR